MKGFCEYLSSKKKMWSRLPGWGRDLVLLARGMLQVSFEIPSSLCKSASLHWRLGHFQNTNRSGYTFWDMLRSIFSQLPLVSMVLLVPKVMLDHAETETLKLWRWLRVHSHRSMCMLNSPFTYESLWADLCICLARLLVPASIESKKHPVQVELEEVTFCLKNSCIPAL